MSVNDICISMRTCIFFGSLIVHRDPQHLSLPSGINNGPQIWDADMQDHFLGECFLPPLGSLSATPKRYVLPVLPAPPEKGATRNLAHDLTIGCVYWSQLRLPQQEVWPVELRRCGDGHRLKQVEAF